MQYDSNDPGPSPRSMVPGTMIVDDVAFDPPGAPIGWMLAVFGGGWFTGYFSSYHTVPMIAASCVALIVAMIAGMNVISAYYAGLRAVAFQAANYISGRILHERAGTRIEPTTPPHA